MHQMQAASRWTHKGKHKSTFIIMRMTNALKDQSDIQSLKTDKLNTNIIIQPGAGNVLRKVAKPYNFS